jgi:hypothetical protein
MTFEHVCVKCGQQYLTHHICERMISENHVREVIFNNLKCKCEGSEYIPSHGVVIGSTCVFCSIKRKIMSDLNIAGK